jgi:transcriptional regulator with XRE-family HTH domain
MYHDDFVVILKKIGKKHFPDLSAKYGFSPKKTADLLSVSIPTLIRWLESKSGISIQKLLSLEAVLIQKGIIDESWNVLDNPVAKPQHPAALAAELEKYKAEREEIRSELTNAIKEVNGHLRTSLKYLDRVRYLESLLNKNNIDFDEME